MYQQKTDLLFFISANLYGRNDCIYKRPQDQWYFNQIQSAILNDYRQTDDDKYNTQKQEYYCWLLVMGFFIHCFTFFFWSIDICISIEFRSRNKSTNGYLSKCIFGTIVHALHTENTLRTVFSFSWVICHVNIHWTDPPALSAMNTFIRITFDSDQWEVTHRLEENSDRADILTERSVVFEYEGKNDTDPVIDDVPRYKCPKHNPFDIADFCKEKRWYEN